MKTFLTRRVVAALFLVVLLTVLAGDDPAAEVAAGLTEARRLFEADRRTEAYAAYRKYLEEADKSRPVSGGDLIRAASLAPTATDAAALMGRHLSKVAASDRSAVLEAEAGYWEAAGNPAAAQRAYAAAFEALPVPGRAAVLLRSAELLMELGEFQAAGEQARAVTNLQAAAVVKIRSLILLARLEAAVGDQTEALRILRELLGAVGEDGLRTTVLFAIVETSLRFGLWNEARSAAAELASKHPGSVEAALAEGLTRGGGSRIKVYPVPSRLLSGGVKLPDPEPAASGSGPTAIQAGSFGSKQNATALASELAKKGFKADVREQASRERVLHRVLIPVSSASGERELLRLKDSGYEGFFVFD